MHSDRGQAHLASLFAILCSVANSAEQGAEVLYITHHSGAGALLAMLNSKLSSAAFAPYADLLDAFVRTTPLVDLLDRPSLQKIQNNARSTHRQVDREHPVWKALTRLFPEALDGMVRAELADLKRLPKWASGPAIPSTEEAVTSHFP